MHHSWSIFCWVGVLLLADPAVIHADDPGEKETVTLEILAASANGQAPNEIRVIATIDSTSPARQFTVNGVGSHQLALPPAGWRLSVQAPGWWSKPADVREGSASVTMWPTGIVKGRIRLPRPNAPVPPPMKVHFSSSPQTIGDSPSVEGEAVCDLTGDRFACEVPSGVLDLKISAADYCPSIAWSVKVEQDSPRDLGDVKLNEGGAVTGWVVSEKRDPNLQEVQVVVSPVTGSPELIRDAQERLALSRHRADVQDSGRFSAMGLPEGTYVLAVTHPRLVGPSNFKIQIQKGIVKEVGEVLLETAATLEAQVDPPTAPGDEPWQLALRRPLPENYTFFEEISVGTTDAAGRWTAAGLEAGTYQLSVRDPHGRQFSAEEINLAPRQPTYVLVDLPLIRVKGRLLSGDEGVSGELVFDSARSSRAPVLLTDGEGEFDGYLPRPGAWSITVRTTEGSEIDLGQMTIRDASQDELVLRLPDTVLRGLVRDEDDLPVGRALIELWTEDGNQRQWVAGTRSDGEGRFTITGFPSEGPLLVEASALSGERSGLVPLWVTEGVEAPEVLLRVHGLLAFEGRVLSREGPVPGAVVELTLRTGPADPLRYFSARLVTDLEGIFRLDIPTGRDLELLVAATGLPVAIRLIPASSLTDDAHVEVLLRDREDAAQLVLDLRELDHHSGDSHEPPWTLVSHGIPVPVSKLLRLRRFEPTTLQQLILTDLEPGTYQFCKLLPSGSACQEVSLEGGSRTTIGVGAAGMDD